MKEKRLYILKGYGHIFINQRKEFIVGIYQQTHEAQKAFFKSAFSSSILNLEYIETQTDKISFSEFALS